jgi:hypothetical protein
VPSGEERSYVRRQQIILDALLDVLNAGLEERTGLEPDPDTEHGGIAFADRSKQRAAGAKLAKDGEGAVCQENRSSVGMNLALKRSIGSKGKGKKALTS